MQRSPCTLPGDPSPFRKICAWNGKKKRKEHHCTENKQDVLLVTFSMSKDHCMFARHIECMPIHFGSSTSWLLKVGIAKSKVSNSTKTHRNGTKNGLIFTAIHLSAALRYFASRRPDDSALVYGISHSEVFNSVCKVVDAVNGCGKLDIQYPTFHQK